MIAAAVPQWNARVAARLVPAPDATRRIVARFLPMPVTIETLQRRMDEAARALDFEEARRCRDMIAVLRGGGTPAEAEAAPLAALDRQRPGSMGLGTSQQRVTPPDDWRPPARPDPMTAGRSKRSRRRGA